MPKKKVKNKPPTKEKYIESPEKLWEHFKAYKTQAKSTPFLQHDFVGKDGDSVNRKKERCLTMVGFEVYCFKNKLINDLGDYFSNKDDRYKTYATICRAILNEIKADQIEGGMAMIYNPSLTARLNGLSDKTEMTVKEQPLFGEDEK